MRTIQKFIVKAQKKYGIYYWDTFDNWTTLVHETDDLVVAEKWVRKHFGDRIKANGADRCEIVKYPEGDIVETYSIG